MTDILDNLSIHLGERIEEILNRLKTQMHVIGARIEEQDVKMIEDAASEIERSRELRRCLNRITDG